MHNYFFPSVAYQLRGFCYQDSGLCAVVKQPFVLSTEWADPSIVEEYLAAGGFIRKRNHDYFCPSLGIILEDLHDENVLSNNGTLYFIDTAFFLAADFFEGADQAM